MFAQFGRIPDPWIPLAVIGFVSLGLLALAGRQLSRLQIAAFAASIAVIVAEAAKDQLKYLFGRTWPETWLHNSPSFIRDGVYGFNFIHGGSEYQSFPSGHMGATCAVMTVLWIWYPRFRWAYGVVAVVVGAALVAGNYHFLSDVLAGAFVGASIGWMTTAVWEAFAPIDPPRLK
jgi:membrane-associated phospholipid phosphatase